MIRTCRRPLFVSSCVSLLEGAHEVLPWWAALSVSTVGVRCVLLPATLAARRANASLARAAPHIRQVNSLLASALKRHASHRAGRLRSIKLYAEALHGTLRLHGANPVTAFLVMPALHIPVFVTFALSVRELASIDDYRTGGILWFIDLAAPDPTFALPFLAVGAAYANLSAPTSELTLVTATRHVVRSVKRLYFA